MLISSDKPEKQGSKQFFAAEIFLVAVKDYPMFSNIFLARIGNNKTEVGDEVWSCNKAERHSIFLRLQHTSVRNVR